MMKVLIADDHNIFREGLRELLGNQGDLEIIGEASDGAEALSKVYSMKPDILILDISMKVLDGLEVVKNIRKMDLPVRVLMLSMHNDAITINKAFQSGADGYVLKEEAFDALEMAIDEVGRGRKFVSPTARQILKSFKGDGEEGRLSPREMDVVKLFAKGMTAKEVSAALSISVKTVETHRQRIMEKLGVHKVTELVRYALKNGLLDE